MNYQRSRLTDFDIMYATDRSNSFKKAAEKCYMEEDGIKRMEQCLCEYHFYYGTSKIGGAAITQANCKLCNDVMNFSNTCCDDLCLPCAKKYKLCRRCAADLKGKKFRKLPAIKGEGTVGR